MKEEFDKIELETRRLLNEAEIRRVVNFDNLPDLAIAVRVGTGEIMAASDEWKGKLKIDNRLMVGYPFIQFVAEQDKERTWNLFIGIETSEPKKEIHGDYDFKNHYLNSEGKPVELAWKSRLTKNGKYVIATARIV
ncbi:hypothetical protein WAF17_21180 [Bernardetia sp. ABR2-2B]|uniref:hypothetical protein n=1 Tax=Bernardetia sp. ABR2-2B TaxID=3127472 RepID=UPI0030D48AFE